MSWRTTIYILTPLITKRADDFWLGFLFYFWFLTSKAVQIYDFVFQLLEYYNHNWQALRRLTMLNICGLIITQEKVCNCHISSLPQGIFSKPLKEPNNPIVWNHSFVWNKNIFIIYQDCTARAGATRWPCWVMWIEDRQRTRRKAVTTRCHVFTNSFANNITT